MGRFAYYSSSTRQPEPVLSDIEITVTTPDEVRTGETLNIEVTLRTLHGTIKDRPVGDIKGKVVILVEGPETQQVVAVGLTNTNHVFAGKNVLLTGGHAEITPTQPGTYTFAPGEITVATSDYPLTSVPKDPNPADSKTTVV
ncbi:hypothetical protein [Plantactinospora endophytica]|uniref:Bacterial Ig domain-containing protein n=1 Tax=Plantactinospora endophytica TaxID=673535 RepID=A0ABQ4E267_9ACTN|nr:hypothetical protein [Plantactinospora endophytica]GIG88770.1 hypothetical protein Pen02_37060 [Plantactinospora endophytica]